MTGGVGFSSQGKDSYKNNRKLLKGRTLMKDNPYSAVNKTTGDRNLDNSKELQEWRDKNQKRANKLRIIIYGIIIPLTIVIALLTVIL